MPRSNKPARVYLSVQHPEFEQTALAFVAPAAFRNLAGPTPLEAAHPLLDPRLEADLLNTRRRDALICRLLEKHGPVVLYPVGSVAESEWLLEALPDLTGRIQHVRNLIWTRIQGASDEARSRSRGTQSATFLRRIGRALAGEHRKRRSMTHPFEVCGAYWGVVFRLAQAHAILALECGCSRNAKVKFAAEACGLLEADLRERLFDAEGEPRRPISVAEQAAIWTARRYGLTAQTVRNHLTPAKRRPFTTA